MAILKITITDDHLKLIKQLRWSVNTENHIVALGHDGVENLPPFGEDNLYEAIDMILNGVPEGFDPFNTDEARVYSQEQMDEWDKLYGELPTVLDCLMYKGDFETGTYKTKWHDRLWKKVSE